MKKTILKNVVLIIMAWVFAFCIKSCFAVEVDAQLFYTNSVLSVMVFLVYFYFIRKITKEEKWCTVKPYLVASSVFCFFFFGAVISGVQLDLYGRVNFADTSLYFSLVALTFTGAPIVAEGMNLLYTKTKINCIEEMPVGRKYFLKVFIILVLSYLLVLIAVWPGFFLYDAETETYMVFTDKYSAHHPMAHVLLLGWIMKVMYKIIPSYNVGIATYLLIQILIVSACFSYMITFMRRIGVRKWIVNTGIIYLALFPTVSMFLCCSTKDVYFSGGVTLFTTLMLELARDREIFWKSKLKCALFIFASLLILLFRNNGLYAFVVFLPFFIIVYKKYWRTWLKLMLIVFTVYVLFNVSINNILDVKPGEKAEMLCVPMQQLARAYIEEKDSFTEEELEILYSLIPESILNNYNPKLADNIKVNFLEDNFSREPKKYISLWFEIGKKHPDIYVNSFLMNTYGYWYPDTIIDGYSGRKIVNREYGESSYFAFETERPGISQPLIPFLAKFYEKISLEIYQQKVPVLSMLFSMGFWLWTYIFAIVYLLKTKSKKQAFAFLPIGIIYLTVILGPIAIVRYVLYLYFCVPLILGLLLNTKAFAEKEQI